VPRANGYRINSDLIDLSLAGVSTVVSVIAGRRSAAPVLSCRRYAPFGVLALLLTSIGVAAGPVIGAPMHRPKLLAATPPMGWNDWAHYQCNYTAQTILDNARALVSSGLAAHGYNTVTIDDCWMQKDRDASGNLQADPQRFPNGVEPVAQAVHALGLKFGIYEDAGFATCGRFAGSGQPKGGGKDHFLQDARLFASWGVDYLKLDGCNVYAPEGGSKEAAYRTAYAAESAALKSSGRAIVFSESAPAYFQGTPEWYDVLGWVGQYGQLWREGSDVANFHGNRPPPPNFHPRYPRLTRFESVLWNYAYNLPLGRFQKPGNWNDADFIIGGDSGMSATETRSQLALWSMMSAPLILSSDVGKLSPEAIGFLGDSRVIAVDQDALGRMATLVRRSAVMDLLIKPLAGGDNAVAVLNRGDAPIRVELHPADFGFAASSGCRLDAQNLWDGTSQPAISSLQEDVASHDTAIWRIHPSASCGKRARTGTIVMTSADRHERSIEGYTRCLAAAGSVEDCNGTAGENWTVTSKGVLRSAGGLCMGVIDGKPLLQACHRAKTQHWRYTLEGNLINATDHQCLSAAGQVSSAQSLQLQPCGHNQPNQIWSLPN
jgi:alpha-galactosidase